MAARARHPGGQLLGRALEDAGQRLDAGGVHGFGRALRLQEADGALAEAGLLRQLTLLQFRRLAQLAKRAADGHPRHEIRRQSSHENAIAATSCVCLHCAEGCAAICRSIGT